MYSRGSEWRKWDLHVHTPCSIHQEYGGNNEEVWEKFVRELEKLDIKVLGINDYWFIDGYKKVLEYKEKGRLQNIELILPIIEVRLKCLVGNKKTKKINYHIIFSNELSPDDIEKEFIEKLEIEGLGNKSLSRKNLEWYGKKLKEEENLPNEEDIKVGFNNFAVTIESIERLLNKDLFKNKYMLAIGKNEWEAFRKDGSLDIKKTLINKADLVFVASETLESFYKSKENLQSMNVNDLLVHCSDSHSFSNGEIGPKKLGYCLTWIKADPTFEGLRQVTYEPDNRLFVGEEPELLKRVRENPTKFIEKIKIDWNENYDGKNGEWFKNIEIPLNYGLISVIGNKGNGKSAIADIIALCGNAHRKRDDFAFLKNDRFLNGNLASNFKATLVWKNGDEVVKNLDDEISFTDVERVKYIPQGFFENLTNQIEEKDFEREIEKIVFSHLPKEERFDKSTFEELVNYKKINVENYIISLKEKLSKINEEIIEYEKMNTNEFINELKGKLKIKSKELEEIEKDIEDLKSQKIENPQINNISNSLYKKIEEFDKNIDETYKLIEQYNKDVKEHLVNIENLNRLKNDYLLIKDRIEDINKANEEVFKKFNLNVNDIVKFSFNENLINEIINKEQEKMENKKQQINELNRKSEELKEKKKEMKLKIDEPIRKYQEYLEKLKTLEERKKKLIGDENTPETLKWIEKRLNYIENELNQDLKKKENERMELVIKIFQKKQEVMEIYNKFKHIIDNEINQYQDLLGDYRIRIHTTLKLDENFVDDFLNYINKKSKGEFHGIDNSKNNLKAYINKYKNFEKEENIKSFLEDLQNALKKENIFKQIKDGKINSFFDFLYSLDYLQPTYKLKLGEKDLNTLSPGERGALLIVFYLMLDKNDIPLIIDQPEENLDNESIYKVLVKFINEVKKRRQIIIITHNPNLAIVGDSDQIIYVRIDKQNSYKFDFVAGSIENPRINELCSRILEGTIKAFDIRRLKYLNLNIRK